MAQTLLFGAPSLSHFGKTAHIKEAEIMFGRIEKIADVIIRRKTAKLMAAAFMGLLAPGGSILQARKLPRAF